MPLIAVLLDNKIIRLKKMVFDFLSFILSVINLQIVGTINR